MKKFLFIILAIVFPSASFSDVASTDYVDKQLVIATADTAGLVRVDEDLDPTSKNPVENRAVAEIVQMLYASLYGMQEAINKSYSCSQECADADCTYMEWVCEGVSSDERAYNTLVMIDDNGAVVPATVVYNGNGAFISEVSIDGAGDKVVITRADVPTPNIATRDTAGIVKMGQIPVGTTGSETASVWIQ